MLDVRLRYAVRWRPLGAKMKAIDFEPNMRGGFLSLGLFSPQRSRCNATHKWRFGGTHIVIIHRPRDGWM